MFPELSSSRWQLPPPDSRHHRDLSLHHSLTRKFHTAHEMPKGHVDRERIAPSPPTQTGQAVLPHLPFQFVASNGLARSGISIPGLRWNRTSRAGSPAPLTCSTGGPLSGRRPTPGRFSGASGRSALRHYPAAFRMELPPLPTPHPCPPWLHGNYSLLRYYEDSDPDRSFGLRPWFPDSL